MPVLHCLRDYFVDGNTISYLKQYLITLHDTRLFLPQDDGQVNSKKLEHDTCLNHWVLCLMIMSCCFLGVFSPTVLKPANHVFSICAASIVTKHVVIKVPPASHHRHGKAEHATSICSGNQFFPIIVPIFRYVSGQIWPEILSKILMTWRNRVRIRLFVLFNDIWFQ